MKKTILYFFIIAIIIILLIVLITSITSANKSCSKYQNYLTGMWIGDPEFIKKSDLTDLQIFIGPKENVKRNGYIIMLDKNNEFILNSAIELKEITSQHAQRWSANTENKKIKDDHFNIEYQVLTDINNVFPKKINLNLSMGNGVLAIKANEKTYALLIKDLIASAEAIASYGK